MHDVRCCWTIHIVTFLNCVCSVAAASNREVMDSSHDNAAVATSDLQLQPAGKMTPDDRAHGPNGCTAKRPKQVPVTTVSSYTVAALQVATNSFCQDSLLGEGSLGRVYKAVFPNGKVNDRIGN